MANISPISFYQNNLGIYSPHLRLPPRLKHVYEKIQDNFPIFHAKSSQKLCSKLIKKKINPRLNSYPKIKNLILDLVSEDSIYLENLIQKLRKKGYPGYKNLKNNLFQLNTNYPASLEELTYIVSNQQLSLRIKSIKKQVFPNFFDTQVNSSTKSCTPWFKTFVLKYDLIEDFSLLNSTYYGVIKKDKDLSLRLVKSKILTKIFTILSFSKDKADWDESNPFLKTILLEKIKTNWKLVLTITNRLDNANLRDTLLQQIALKQVAIRWKTAFKTVKKIDDEICKIKTFFKIAKIYLLKQSPINEYFTYLFDHYTNFTLASPHLTEKFIIKFIKTLALSRYNEALSIVSSFHSNYLKDLALTAIVNTQVSLDYKKALEIAHMINNETLKNDALDCLSLYLIRKVILLANYKKAIGLAHKLKSPNNLKNALEEIAIAQASTNCQEALNIVKMMDANFYRKDTILAKIAISQLPYQYEKALEIIQLIKYDIDEKKVFILTKVIEFLASRNLDQAWEVFNRFKPYSDLILLQLVKAQSTRNFEKAYQIANTIESFRYKHQAFIELVKVQVSFNFEKACELAHCLESFIYQDQASLILIKSQISIDFEHAVHLTRCMRHSVYKDLALLELIKVQAPFNFEYAMNLAKSIEFSGYIDLAFLELIKARLASSYFDQAYKLIDNLKLPIYKEQALCYLIKELAVVDHEKAYIMIKEIKIYQFAIQAFSHIIKAQPFNKTYAVFDLKLIQREFKFRNRFSKNINFLCDLYNNL